MAFRKFSRARARRFKAAAVGYARRHGGSMKAAAIEAATGVGAGVAVGVGLTKVQALSQYPYLGPAGLILLGYIAKKKNTSIGSALIGAGGFMGGRILANTYFAPKAGAGYVGGQVPSDVAGYMANGIRGSRQAAGLMGPGMGRYGAAGADAGAVSYPRERGAPMPSRSASQFGGLG